MNTRSGASPERWTARAFSYNNCQKATFTVDEDGNETYVIDYNNGSGCIYSDYTSGMCWDDYEEGVADGMTFNR